MLPLVVMVACLAGANAATPGNGRKVELPDYFPKMCARNDPKLAQCIKANMQKVFPRLINGERDFGLEVLEPISIPEVRMETRREPMVVSAAVKNSRTYGLDGLQIKNVRVKRITNDNLDMEVDFFVPKALVEGDIKLDGHIGNFPTTGNGFFNISLTGVDGTWKIKGSAVEVAGERYMKIRSFYLYYSLANMKVYATNVVDRAPELTALVVQMVNQFWSIIFRAVDPYTREPFCRVLTPLANTVFLKVPYDQLFPVA